MLQQEQIFAQFGKSHFAEGGEERNFFSDQDNAEGFFFAKEKNRELHSTYSDIFIENKCSKSDRAQGSENYFSTSDVCPNTFTEFNPNTELMNPVKEADDQISKENAYSDCITKNETPIPPTDPCQKTGDINEALDQIFSEPIAKVETQKYKIDLAIRKDVVNKNILRIASRYFKDILITHFPSHKKSLKSAKALEHLLTKFCDFIFPNNFDPDLKYSLGAFILAPKMKILNCSSGEKAIIFEKVRHIHKTLSKYTHKDLNILLNWDRRISMGEYFDTPTPNPSSPACSIPLILLHFYHNGQAYFKSQETVQRHKSVYSNALESLKSSLLKE